MRTLPSLFSRAPDEVEIVEVGPRDGLQNEPDLVPAAEKVSFVGALARTGLRHIEVTSFVRPDLVPQLADAREVFSAIERRPGVRYTVLVPNERGLERALEAGAESIAVLTAASDSFNRRNLGCDTRESLARIRRLAEEVRRRSLALRAYVSTAFVCPFEGPVEAARAAAVVEALWDLGIEEVSLGDTIGAAFPTDVSRLLEALESRRGLDGVALHLHDTYRRALANALAGLLHGVRVFDASAGGLGGCPFAPGARGNVATEELAGFFEGMGIRSGVDASLVRRALDSIGRPPRS